MEELVRTSIRVRRRPSTGPTVVRRWATGCGPVPLSSTSDVGAGFRSRRRCSKEGFTIYGVDASATLIAKFRERFPGVPLECSPVEESLFFSRSFDAAVAWGLMFLLPVDTQRNLIGKVARALNPNGHLSIHGAEGSRYMERRHDRSSVLFTCTRSVRAGARSTRSPIGWKRRGRRR
ncbi:MAG: methyltransferase domain-containing protein [Luteitalea sp.]|nr:methyltransferase domain-containing protein [Luteitalea sp.]